MSEQTMTGGCLCGAVRYRVEGEARKFYHCHCERCRKATGTGHASNILVAPGRLTFTAGEGALRSYKVPEAKRFTNVFCTTCGGRLPRFVPETNFIVIPAGSLDGEPTIAPQARIFWASRAAWSCSDDGLPTHAEYAPP